MLWGRRCREDDARQVLRPGADVVGNRHSRFAYPFTDETAFSAEPKTVNTGTGEQVQQTAICYLRTDRHARFVPMPEQEGP